MSATNKELIKTFILLRNDAKLLGLLDLAIAYGFQVIELQSDEIKKQLKNWK